MRDPPAQWREVSDLVVEVITVPSAPEALHTTAITNLRRVVAPGGTLLVIPLRRNAVEAFAANNALHLASLLTVRRW